MSLSSSCFQVKGPAEAAGRYGPHHHQPVPAAGKPQTFPLPVIRDDQLNDHIKSRLLLCWCFPLPGLRGHREP